MVKISKSPWSYGELVEMDEDDCHEFKMHRSICIEEISAFHEARSRYKIVRTKQPASKTLCAFLNAPMGGQLYLGIDDDGRVVGMQMTQDQCNHMLLSLHDTIQRFKPPVPPGRISLQFLSVDDSADGAISKMPPLINRTEQRRHMLRTSNCWCERETASMFNQESSLSRYLVVIIVSPWDSSNAEQAGSIDALMPPVFQNEEGLCYKRRAASNANWSIDAIRRVTEDLVTTYYEEQRERLEKQIEDVSKGFSWCSMI